MSKKERSKSSKMKNRRKPPKDFFASLYRHISEKFREINERRRVSMAVTSNYSLGFSGNDKSTRVYADCSLRETIVLKFLGRGEFASLAPVTGNIPRVSARSCRLALVDALLVSRHTWTTHACTHRILSYSCKLQWESKKEKYKHKEA